ncbi:MAG: tetratricopeptide repeat protein [Spirochaetales bacterium]|nr:tetratricopeptide repeat protein [Spirochaetales bacterium]
MSDKMNMADRLAVFLTERRALVIAVLAVAVIIIVAAAVWAPIRDNMVDKNAMAAEEIDELYSQWMFSFDDEKPNLEEEFLSTTEAVLAKGGANYAVQRAYFMRGQYYITQEMWTEASTDFVALADGFPQSYLAPVSLFNAAAAMEEAAMASEAALLYERLVNEYGENAPEAAEALFNMARLAEEAGDNTKATEYYETLIADYGTTDWKNIAKTRILLMN